MHDTTLLNLHPNPEERQSLSYLHTHAPTRARVYTCVRKALSFMEFCETIAENDNRRQALTALLDDNPNKSESGLPFRAFTQSLLDLLS